MRCIAVFTFVLATLAVALSGEAPTRILAHYNAGTGASNPTPAPSSSSTASTSPSPSPTSSSVPYAIKVWMGAPWQGNGANGGYGCGDPTWTGANGTGGNGTDFSALNNLVFLMGDYCTGAYPAIKSTAPNIHTIFYYDPGMICNPDNPDNCSERPALNSLNTSTDVLQCGSGSGGSGPFVGYYVPGENVDIPDPGASNVGIQTQDVMNTLPSLDIAWWDNEMIPPEEYYGGANNCTSGSDWQNMTFGDGTAYTDSAWITRYEAMINSMNIPIMTEGLGNGSGADLAGYGVSIADGDARDPGPSITAIANAANSWGGMHENFAQCWNAGSDQINNKAVDNNGGPAWYNYCWSMGENESIELTSAGKYFIGLPYQNKTNDADMRGYAYSSSMMVYDPNYSILTFYYSNVGTGASDQLEPEMGLVALNPRVAITWPTRVAALQISGGVYVREFQNCYYFGHSVGNCAFVVNPSASNSYSLPSLTGTYNYSVTLYDHENGVFNGQWGQPNYGDPTNSIAFNGAVPTSIPAVGWAILIQNIPTGGP